MFNKAQDIMNPKNTIFYMSAIWRHNFESRGTQRQTNELKNIDGMKHQILKSSSMKPRKHEKQQKNPPNEDKGEVIGNWETGPKISHKTKRTKNIESEEEVQTPIKARVIDTSWG